MPSSLRRLKLSILFFAFILTACSGETIEPSPTPTTTQSAPTPPPDPQQILSPITPENAFQITQLYQSGGGTLNDLTVSPDGSTFALCGSLGIWLLDSQSLEITSFIKNPNGTLSTIAWSPDSHLLATGSTDGSVRLWDPAAQDQINLFSNHIGQINSLSWSPDGKMLVSASNDHTIIIWDTQSGDILYQLEEHQKAAKSVSWSPDGKWIASGGLDGSLIIWDASTGEKISELAAHEGWITSLSWAIDSTRLASGSVDRHIILWDTSTQEIIFNANHFTNISAISWSADENTILTGGGGPYTINVWNAETGEQENEFPGFPAWIKKIVLIPNAPKIAILTQDSGLQIWDTRFDQTVRQLDPAPNQFVGHLTAVDWSPTEAIFATGGLDGIVRLWDSENGTLLQSLTGHTSAISDIHWSPSGDMLASSSADGTVNIWESLSGESLMELSAFNGPISSIAWNNNGSRIAAGTSFGIVQIWDSERQRLDFSLFPDLEVESLAWAHHGGLIAAGTIDGIIHIWDTDTGQRLHQLAAHSGRASNLIFSPDSTQLLSMDHNGNGFIWDPISGEKLLTLNAQYGQILDVAWSPDGKLITVASTDSSILIWDALSGEILNLLLNHREQVDSLAWSPNGEKLISIGRDGTLIAWGIPSQTSPPISHPPLPPTYNPSTAQISSLVINTTNADQLVSLYTIGRGLVNSASLSPDSNYLAIASAIGTWLYDSQTLEPLHNIPSEQIYTASWAPNSETLAIRQDEKILLLNTPKLQYLQAFHSGYTTEHDAVWSPDGKMLAAASIDGSIQIWGLPSSSLLRSLSPDEEVKIDKLSWSPNHTMLAAAIHSPKAENSRIILWNIFSEEIIQELRGQQGIITTISFAPTTNYLASGSSNGTIWIWDAQRSLPLASLDPAQPNDPLDTISWSKDSTLIAVGYQSGTIIVWDIESEEAVARSNSSQSFPEKIDWLDAQTLQITNKNGQIDQWQLPDSHTLFNALHHEAVQVAALSPDNTLLAAAHTNGTLNIWDTDNWEIQQQSITPDINFTALAWSPNQNYLAAASSDLTLTIWPQGDLDDPQVLFQSQQTKPDLPTNIQPSIAWSPDGSRLAFGSNGLDIQILELAQPQNTILLPAPLPEDLPAHTTPDQENESGTEDLPWPTSLAWSPDGEILAAGDNQGNLFIWDASTNKLLQVLPAYQIKVYALAWSPDSSVLAISGTNGSFEQEHIRLWERKNTRLITAFELEWIAELRSLSWSPDGSILSIGYTDSLTTSGKLTLWNYQSQEIIANIEAHNAVISSISWSSNTQYIITTSMDGTIKIWGIPEK